MMRAGTTHQQVIVTRWWSWGLIKAGEDKKNTPTSHNDSLVVWVIREDKCDSPTSHHDSLVVILVMSHVEPHCCCWLGGVRCDVVGRE